MTERGPLTGLQGAPNPAEPSHPGDSPPGDSPAPATGLPADLGAVRRTDELIESLARRAAGSAARPETGRPRLPDPGRADDRDPAVRLLGALITDVDDQDPGPETAPPPPSGPRRRGPRTIVALGVAGAVLASSGVAAAGGGVADRTAASPAPSTSGVSDDADRATADTDADLRGRKRSPVRPAPEPGGPTARKQSGSPDPGRIKRRLERAIPRRPERDPAPAVNSAPSTRPDTAREDDARSRLDDLRREARKRALGDQPPGG
ncbi:hypothetical protein ACQPZP_38815 [Spirillospora sp. CA-142024]|uniref:hypothetical protein n=1 Tax=Spirillospora sp. CA-142024 TaxID=3240036 RepID=UPI003D8D3B49